MSQDNLKAQTKRGLYWSFFNQVANTGMQFVIGIFMARLLSPSDYGLTALPAVFMAVAGIFVGGGFSDALIRKKELKEEDLSTAFYYSIIVGATCYTCLFLAAPWIADFYNAPILKPMMRVTALSFLWSPLNSPQNVILKRKLDFKTPTKVSIVGCFLSGVTGITLAYNGLGVWALVISGLFGGILSLCLNWYVVRWYPKTGWSKESFSYLWNYGNKLMASGLLDTLYNNITPIFIGKYYSPADLGVYNRASTYAKLPSSQLTATIQSVTFPVISKIQDDEERLAHTYRKMLKVTAFIVFPAMMLLAALAHPLVIVMITAKWESCIILLQIMCFSMMWYPIHAINLNLLLVKGRSDLFLRLEFIKKGIGLSILVFTLPLGLVYFCIGGIVSSLLCLVVNTYYTGKLINCGYFTQMKDLIPTLLLSFAMLIAVLGVNSLIESNLIKIIVGGIVGVTTYLAVAILFKMPEINEVKYMILRKKGQ